MEAREKGNVTEVRGKRNVMEYVGKGTYGEREEVPWGVPGGSAFNAAMN
jgi:hypothetical protein